MKRYWQCFFLASAVLLFVTACGSSNPTQQNQSLADQATVAAVLAKETPTLTAPQAEVSPREVVLAVLRYQCSYPFWSASTITDRAEKTRFYWRYVPPDRYHFVYPDREFIMVGNDTFALLEGKWKYVDTGDSYDNPPCSENRFETISNAALAGIEIVGGKPTIVYTFNTLADREDPKSGVSTKIWISLETGWVLRSESTILAQDSTNVTLQVYIYDPGIQIEAPAKKPQ